MKNFKKHPVTTVFGILLWILCGYKIYMEAPAEYIAIPFAIGFVLFFLKDTWINKIFTKILGKV